MRYPFNLVSHKSTGPVKDNSLLRRRPFAEHDRSFEADAQRFVPGDALETAINTSIAVGEPLLVTGEPGTGKTQAAYYAAYKLDVEPVIHFQVKSDTRARDLLYEFDTVRYFRDAHIAGQVAEGFTPPDKSEYLEHRALWDAFDMANQTGIPRVLLIDEIDKAPRDFPNDLLHELDKMAFHVIETKETVSTPKELRPLVFITSNSERRLPEPFLRRCVYHHIRFDEALVKTVIQEREGMFKPLEKAFLDTAVRRFLALRELPLRKRPATGELIVWLSVLASATGTYPEKLGPELEKLPYIGVLLKDHKDIEELTGEL